MQVCFVAFWDDITLSAQEYEKQTIGEDGFIGKWRIVVVKELPFTDQRLNGKIPKVGSANIGPEFLLKILCKLVHSLLILPVTRCLSLNLFLIEISLFLRVFRLYIQRPRYTQMHIHLHIAIFLIVGVTYCLFPCKAFYSLPIYLQS